MGSLVKVVCLAALIWMAVPPSQLRADPFHVVFTPSGTINAASTGSSFGPPFNYGFTPVGNFASVMGNGVTISSISVSADGHMIGTSGNVTSGTFVSFDWEVFVGPPPFGFPPGQTTGSSIFPESITSSAPTQFRFAEFGATTTGATLTFPGSYDFTTNTFSTGSFTNNLKAHLTSPMNLSQGLDVQVMLWSEAPGTNIDFSNIKVEINGVTPTQTPEPGTLVLLSSGIFGLLGYARRRRKLP